MKNKFNEILLRAKHLILRFPMILTMAFLASASAILMSENPVWKDDNYTYTKFTIVSCLGISLMFALKMISQRIGKEIVLQLLGIAFLISFLFFLPAKSQFFTENYVILIISVFILSHLLVAFGAFLQNNNEMAFWQYNKNLFVNLFLTIVFTGVFTAGVELAILAVDKLFDLDFVNRVYTNTFYFFLIFGSAFIFLLFSENGLSHLEKDSNYPVILKFFTQFILIPLLVIYLCILYFYSVKIIFLWELPRGWVSYLVLAYSVLGILALLLVHPLKDDSAKSWVKGFSKIFYYTLLPLLLLLYVAIFTRILEYGFTEPRYFVLLIAIWLSGVIVYFVFSKKPNIRFIPTSLFVLGFFSLIFPYFNAFSVAKRSQEKELLQVLENNKLLEDGKIDFSKKINYKTVLEIGDKFEFLTSRKRFDVMLNLIPESNKPEFRKEMDKMNSWQVNNLVRKYFINSTGDPNSGINYLELVSTEKVMDIHHYDYLIDYRTIPAKTNLQNSKEIKIGEDKILIKDELYGSPPVFEISLESGEKKNLMPELVKIMEKHKNQNGQILVKEIPVQADLGKYEIRLMLDNVWRNNDKYYFSNALILVKKR